MDIKKRKSVKNIILNNLVMIIIASIITVICSLALGYSATILFSADQVKYDNTASGLTSTNVQAALDELCQTASDGFVDRMYPVGSIYLSVDLATVADVEAALGGTWEVYANGAGRALVGAGTGTDANNTSKTFTEGATGGTYKQTLAVTNIPSHTHSMAHTHSSPALSGSCGAAGGHSHTVSGTLSSAGAHTHNVTGTCASTGAHTHTLTTVLRSTTGTAEYTGGLKEGGLWNEFTWRLRGDYGCSMSGNHSHVMNITIANAGAHTHTVTATASQGTTAATGANHTHSSTTTATNTDSITANTGSTGSGTAFTTMDPYVTVYMYRRTG